MSADTRPISPARFASALKDLSVSMLHLKSLEIGNSIAHLQYSNDQLRPFAEGTATALSTDPSTTETAAAAQPDQDCIDAIRENEVVIDRMAERIALIRAEVEERGVSWADFQSMAETHPTTTANSEGDAGPVQQKASGALTNGVGGDNAGEGSAAAQSNGAQQPSPWTDGTFQTGTIQNGQVRFDSQPGGPSAAQGGSLSDEQLGRALDERLGSMLNDDEDESGGLHL